MSEHPERRAVVLHAVHLVPGAHLRGLQRITGLAFGTLRYHADVLVGAGRVRAEHDRRFVRYYPMAMPPEERRTWDAVRLRVTRVLLAALVEAPRTQAELAAAAGLGSSSVHRYARRLRDLGVAHESAGRLWVSWPDTARRLLAAVDPGYLDRLTDGAVDLFDQLDG